MRIDFAALRAKADALEVAADDLDSVEAAPANIAGAEPEVLINAMLAQVTSSAGAVVDGLNAAAETIRTCMSYYELADASAAADLEAIDKYMEER